MFTIEEMGKLSDKQIWKRYSLAIFLVLLFQITMMVLIKELRGIPMSISVGFNIGLWVGFTLVWWLK